MINIMEREQDMTHMITNNNLISIKPKTQLGEKVAFYLGETGIRENW